MCKLSDCSTEKEILPAPNLAQSTPSNPWAFSIARWSLSHKSSKDSYEGKSKRLKLWRGEKIKVTLHMPWQTNGWGPIRPFRNIYQVWALGSLSGVPQYSMVNNCGPLEPARNTTRLFSCRLPHGHNSSLSSRALGQKQISSTAIVTKSHVARNCETSWEWAWPRVCTQSRSPHFHEFIMLSPTLYYNGMVWVTK